MISLHACDVNHMMKAVDLVSYINMHRNVGHEIVSNLIEVSSPQIFV